MAYNKKKLSGNVGVGAGVPTLYVYSTDDTLATAVASGYFNDSADILEVNDIIQVDGATFGIFRVATNDGSVVTTVSAIAEV